MWLASTLPSPEEAAVHYSGGRGAGQQPGAGDVQAEQRQAGPAAHPWAHYCRRHTLQVVHTASREAWCAGWTYTPVLGSMPGLSFFTIFFCLFCFGFAHFRTPPKFYGL